MSKLLSILSILTLSTLTLAASSMNDTAVNNLHVRSTKAVKPVVKAASKPAVKPAGKAAGKPSKKSKHISHALSTE